MQLSPKEIKEFQILILDWYKKNKRVLPWRHPSLPTSPRLRGSRKLRNGLRDPYKILVSEVMLQQTQVSRVIPKYEVWMRAFPTVQDLAKASTRDVLHYWSGLGYNRRALYLKKCAEELVNRHSGKRSAPRIDSGVANTPQNDDILWPQTEKELRQLPGIGEYTARAVLCFAFNHQIAVVDTNVRKVILIHWKLDGGKWKLVKETGKTKLEEKSSFKYPTSQSSVNLLASRFITKNNVPSEKDIQNLAEQLVPHGRAYDWNQALMDYASAELKAHKIPIPKQSKFADSDRYFRGQTIKLLLTRNNQSFASLWKNINKIKEIEKGRYTNIINQLEKDKLITKKGSMFTLPE